MDSLLNAVSIFFFLQRAHYDNYLVDLNWYLKRNYVKVVKLL